MSISVNFENPIGSIVGTRQFSPGDRIRVSGNVSGFIPMGAPGVLVSVDVVVDGSSVVYGQDKTSLLGNYGVDITLPDYDTRADVIVIGSYGGGTFYERVVVPIGIGILPEPIPELPESQWEKYLKYAAIGALVLVAVYGIAKVTPAVVTARRAVKRKNPRSLKWQF